ncbi:MAG: phosphoribosylamine--glycine ligase [Acetobacteraceae bacterium]|nr:phosphoribosylamine--glycine ligase [Acetobacteraceae bacterium]MCX7685476.1 phosphoribosylamine--glycine ligase [Acetobacteraceae bacterium]MDW8399252.1 phosphoribosylamine--glycine ligase [Acetobacteraceae bacterium]
MIRFAPLALTAALAACAAAAPEPPLPQGEAERAAIAACRAEAQNDPRLVALGRRVLPGNERNRILIEEERRAIEADAIARCLRARGAGPRGGGVEAVRR